MANQKIWQKYVFAKLNDNNEIVYFKPYKGGLKVVTTTASGKTVTKVILNPSESDMNAAGWYRLVNVQEDGEDAVIDNVLYHYTGAIDVSEEGVA